MTTYNNIPILAPGEFTAMDGQAVRITEGGLLGLEAELAGRKPSANADASVPLNLEHNSLDAWTQAPVAAQEGRQAEAPAATREENGRAAIGDARNIRYDPLRRQLIADLRVTDSGLGAAIAAGRYQSRSAELELGDSPRLTGLALLERLSPAVAGLGGLGSGGDPPATKVAAAGAGWATSRRPCQITRNAIEATHHISIYGGTQ